METSENTSQTTMDIENNNSCEESNIPSKMESDGEQEKSLKGNKMAICSDGVRVELSDYVIRRSRLLRKLFKYSNEDGEDIEFPFTSRILKLIIQYCDYYGRNPDKEIDDQHEEDAKKFILVNNIDDWAREFFKDMTVEDLKEFIQAAHFLADYALQSNSTKFLVVTRIKGKTAEEIREAFGLVDDLTSEEKSKITEMMKWARSIK